LSLFGVLLQSLQQKQNQGRTLGNRSRGELEISATTILRRIEMRRFQLYGLAAFAVFALSGPALAAGDATKGKAAFAKCGICHQVGPNAKTLVGPELNSIVGRKAASVADYAYSAGMKKLGDEGYVWSEENLDKWIADPKAMIPDSPMALAFPGIPDAGERADIIAYLKTQTGQ
jgi:cytochrome c